MVRLSYAVQPSPDGLAQAFIIGADFIGDDCVAMVLGDNIFAGHGFKKRLVSAVKNAENALKEIADYVCEHTNEEGAIADIIEKFGFCEER